MSLGQACRNGCQTSCSCDYYREEPTHSKYWTINGLHMDFKQPVTREEAEEIVKFREWLKQNN